MIETQLIAVVDDDASAREAVAGLVKALGYMVCVFESAEAFLAAELSVERRGEVAVSREAVDDRLRAHRARRVAGIADGTMAGR